MIAYCKQHTTEELCKWPITSLYTAICQDNGYQHSYFLSVIRQWDSLSSDVATAKTLDMFRL